MRWKTAVAAFMTILLGLWPGVVGMDDVLAQMRGGPGDFGPGTRGGQRGAPNPDKAREQMRKSFEELLEYLALDRERETQARRLFDSQQETMKKLMESLRKGNLDRTVARDSMQAVAADYRENFNNLLDAAERKKLEEWSSINARRGGAVGDGQFQSRQDRRR